MEVKEVLENFKDLVFKDKKLNTFRSSIKNGGTFEDVEEYAKRLAELMVESLKGLPEGTDLVPFLKEFQVIIFLLEKQDVNPLLSISSYFHKQDKHLCPTVLYFE